MTIGPHSRAHLRALLALPAAADAAERLFHPSDRTTVLDAFSTAVQTLLGPSSCTVYLVDVASGTLSTAPHHFTAQPPHPAQRGPDRPFIVSSAAHTKQAHYLAGDGRPTSGGGGVPAQAALPLIAREKLVGVLYITNDDRQPFSERVRPALQGLAAIGGLALHRVLVLEELQRLAMTDGLTGLANQRAFTEALTRELARVARTKESLSIVLIELDRFKHVNDRHGHLRGDEVLRQVAVALKAACRAMDMAVRLGGDEFALVLPGTSKHDALQIADRVRLRIREIGQAEVVRLTASLGVATTQESGITPEGLIDIADRAMYRAKRAGGNRVGILHAGVRRRVVPGVSPRGCPRND